MKVLRVPFWVTSCLVVRSVEAFYGVPSSCATRHDASSVWRNILGASSPASSYYNNAPPAFQDPALENFRQGSVPLVCLDHAVRPDQVEAWKQDAMALQSLAFGATAGVASRHADIRSGVHQVWLQSPLAAPPPFLVGNLDARKELLQWVEGLRVSLHDDHVDGLRSLPPELIELSYLIYNDQGAAYAKHVDSFANDADRKRCVSFLLYLGSADDDNRPWDCQRDGGALRIHDQPYCAATGRAMVDSDDDASWSDITPHAGTLVLFDSATVPHEVIMTKRSRVCIVGWLGTYAKASATSE